MQKIYIEILLKLRLFSDFKAINSESFSQEKQFLICAARKVKQKNSNFFSKSNRHTVTVQIPYTRNPETSKYSGDLNTDHLEARNF